LFGGEISPTKRILSFHGKARRDWRYRSFLHLSRGDGVLVQSASPDWSRRKISLCGLRASAVKQVLKRGLLLNESENVILNLKESLRCLSLNINVASAKTILKNWC